MKAVSGKRLAQLAEDKRALMKLIPLTGEEL